MALFERYIGIDYSGAVTPESSCKGIRDSVTGTEEERHTGRGGEG
jgi:hypothetical protein